MKSYTFTENNVTFKRINKKQARKAYNNGLTVRFCPCNLRPGPPFWPDMDMNKTENCASATFDRAVNVFELFNCRNRETGKYTAFYVQVDMEG